MALNLSTNIGCIVTMVSCVYISALVFNTVSRIGRDVLLHQHLATAEFESESNGLHCQTPWSIGTAG